MIPPLASQRNFLASGAAVPPLYWTGFLLALAAVLSLWVDVPLCELARSVRVPSDLRRAIYMMEAYGHGTGVVLVLVTIWVLDLPRRRFLPRLAAGAVGAGLAANVVKCCFPRLRPNRISELADSEQSLAGWFIASPADGSEIARGYDIQSFPSGHSAVAVALTIGLCHLYPRGRWLFIGLALLTMTQRVLAGSHFPSDTLAAASLACLVAQLCQSTAGPARWFDRWERREESASAGVPCRPAA